jgi:hypothetical protein
VKTPYERLAAATIIVIALGLSIVWVFRVPFFQSPDENAHADYAFALFTAHAPIRARDARPATDVHPLVRYLEDNSGFRTMRYNQDGRVVSRYGTPEYFRKLDAGAPSASSDFLARAGGRVPWVARQYAYLYYALDAVAIGIGALVSGGSAVAEFFAARLFNVVLLGITLALIWLTLVELRLDPVLRLVILAAMAWFPLTSWVSAYVQSDNLAFTAVALVFYLAVRLRREPDTIRAALWLGLALGLLALTKPQYFVAAALPPFADRTLRSAPRLRSTGDWAKYVGLVMGPPVLCCLSALWISAGAGHQFATSVAANANPLGVMWAKGLLPFVGYVIEQFENAWRTTFYYGLPFVSYWGMISWTGYRFEFGTPAATDFVFTLIGLLSQVVAVMIAVRAILVWGRLVTVARRYSPYAAAKLLASDVLLNSYFLFGLVIFAVLISTGGQLGTQGRYWLPFILPATLCATVYAPQVFRRRRARRLPVTAFGTGLLAYSVVATFAGFAGLEARFYRPPTALHDVEYFARITRLGAYNLYEPQSVPLHLARHGRYPIEGWAIDSRSGRPAQWVRVGIIDPTTTVQSGALRFGSDRPGVDWSATRYGAPRPDAVDRLHDDDLLNTGFSTTLAAADLAPGLHGLRLTIGERGGGGPYYSRAVVEVFIDDR